MSGPALLSLSVAAILLSQSPQAPSAPPPKTPTQIAAAQNAMNGVWDYNDDFSVDAGTGRPEQAPLSATQRPRNGGAGAGRTTGSGSLDQDFERRVMAMYVAERRALIRDLLEVAETLTIRSTAAAVTFTDDLRRERTYPTSGKSQKYQLGAAQFEARAVWDGVQFRKDIEGANNFQMSETYFLSDDFSRLIVIIRIGDPKKPTEQFGVNRVYDRVTK